MHANKKTHTDLQYIFYTHSDSSNALSEAYLFRHTHALKKLSGKARHHLATGPATHQSPIILWAGWMERSWRKHQEHPSFPSHPPMHKKRKKKKSPPLLLFSDWVISTQYNLWSMNPWVGTNKWLLLIAADYFPSRLWQDNEKGTNLVEKKEGRLA